MANSRLQVHWQRIADALIPTPGSPYDGFDGDCDGTVRQLRHHFGGIPSLRDVCAPYRPAHAVYCAVCFFWLLFDLVTMLIGCRLVLAIRWCDRSMSSGQLPGRDRCKGFDIGLDRTSQIFQPCPAPHTTRAMLCLVAMWMEC